MSDTNDIKQDDDIIQSDVSVRDDAIVQEDTNVHGAGVDESFTFTSSERTPEDIDDGDDEDGIFAAPTPPVKKKSGGNSVAAVAAVIAVVAVGGAAYYHNPDIINQVMQNVSGEASEIMPDELSGAITESIPDTPVTNEPVVTTDNTDGMPSGSMIAPEPVVAEVAPPVTTPEPMPVPTPDNLAEVITVDPVSADAADNVVVASNNTPPAEPKPVAHADQMVNPVPILIEEGASKEITPDTASAQLPNIESTVPNIETPIVHAESAPVSPSEPTMSGGMEAVDLTAAPTDGTGVPEVKVIEPPKEEPVSAAIDAQASATTPSVTETTVTAEVPSVNQVEAVKPQEQTAAPVPSPTELVSAEKSSEPRPIKSQDEKDAELNKALGINDAASQKAEYFDSPSGKILSSIPAPSMNPLKGKGESIIIVHGKDDKKSLKDTTITANAKKPKGKVSITRTDIDAQIVAASRALKLERYEAAAEMYDKLYDMNPRDGRILMGRAVLLQKTGQSEQAISAYEEVLKVDPSNTDAVVNLAGLIRKRYPAAALSKLLDMKEQYPHNVSILAQLGVAYADSGNFEDAYRSLSQASLLEPQNPQHYYNMAVIAERLRDSAKAVSLYEKALEADALHGSGRGISRERIYDRLTQLRGN